MQNHTALTLTRFRHLGGLSLALLTLSLSGCPGRAAPEDAPTAPTGAETQGAAETPERAEPSPARPEPNPASAEPSPASAAPLGTASVPAVPAAQAPAADEGPTTLAEFMKVDPDVVTTTWIKGREVEEVRWGGRLRERSSFGGGLLSNGYRYDRLGRLSEIESLTAPRRRLRYLDGAGQVAIFDQSDERMIVRVLEAKERKLAHYETQDGSQWSFQWDGERVVRESGPRGERDYRYDALGRLRSWSDSSGREVFVSRSGATTQVSSSQGDVVWTIRDDEGLLRAAGQGEREHAFRYAGTGELLEARSPEGTFTYREPEEGQREHAGPFGTTTYTLSGLAPAGRPRVRAVDSPAGTFSLAHDAQGFRTRLSYPNGVEARYQRSTSGQVERIRSEVLELEQSWNRRQQLTRQVLDGQNRTFGYDGFGWLTRVTDAAGERAYERDPNGERILVSRPGVDTRERLVVSSQGRLVQRVGERRVEGAWRAERVLATYEVDAAGRLLAIHRLERVEADRFRYDAFGRLEEVQRVGRPAVRYGYDALGRLATRSAEGLTTRYVYDGLRLVAEISPQRTRVYAHGPDLDEPLAYRDDQGPWVFLHADERGTILAYSDAQGARIDAARYSPEGALEQAPRPGRPLRYAGHRYDPLAGLVLMRARAYDPELGRFLSADPAGIRDGSNPFLYAQGNPLSHVDPLGLWAQHPSIRVHYGSLSPSAQLLLLGKLRDLLLSPTPHLDVEAFVEETLPGIESQVPASRKTGAASVRLAEDLAQAPTRADAQALLDSPQGVAARGELGSDSDLWRVFQGVAEVEDDAERLNDAGLLRRFHAATDAERELNAERVRRVRIYGDLAGKHLESPFWAASGEELRALELSGSDIDHNRLLTLASTEFPRMNAIQQAALTDQIEALTRVPRVAARREGGKVVEPTGISVRDHAIEQERLHRYHSARPERENYQRARRALAAIRARHAEDLSSTAKLREAIVAAQIQGPNKLEQLRLVHHAQELPARRWLELMEDAFRRAMVWPLGHAVASERIAAHTDHYFDKAALPAFLADSRAAGKELALRGDLQLRTHVLLPAPVDYEARFAALRAARQAEQAEAQMRREREDEQAEKERRYVEGKARSRRGRVRRGVTAAGADTGRGQVASPGRGVGVVQRLQEQR